MRYLAAFIAAAATGCSGTSTVLLPPELSVVHFDAASITVQWNTARTTEEAARQRALFHCPDGVAPVGAATDGELGGLYKQRTWRCTR